MARIRSLKPEAFQSESLAKVSVSAERTFYGMSTIADDRGRLPDKAAQINGELWSMRGNHTAAELDDELEQLVKADGLVCRYTGCDGRRYLHLVTWDRHQKIDHPSKTRLPRCPQHTASAVTGRAEECGLHGGDCPPRDTLARTREASETVASTHEASRHSREDSRGFGEGSRQDLGPRTVDLGVPPTADAGKPRPAKAAPPSEANIGTVVAAYVDGATEAGLKGPASSLRARVGKQARLLLADGYDIGQLVESARRMGAGEWNDLAVQVRKDDASANGRAPLKGHQPYRNPDDESAYEGDL